MNRSNLSAISFLSMLFVLLLCFTGCNSGSNSGSPSQDVFVFYQNPNFQKGYTNPLSYRTVPQHPHLRPNGQSNLHNDAQMTDTYVVSGPTGLNHVVDTSKAGDSVNMYVTITFDSMGRMVASKATVSGIHIVLVDPDTLEELAIYSLPEKPDDWPDDPLYPYKDTSGGAYFVLDSQDYILVGGSYETILILKYSDEAGEFKLISEFDLSAHLADVEPPRTDRVQMTLPDWDGLLWFATRYGRVGTIDRDSGEVNSIEFGSGGEEMQNSFTVGKDGVYIVTDHALYRLNASETGHPVIDWRTEYDRGTRTKPGMMHQGSGQTPLLIGDIVVIGDNADPKMNLLFLKRSDGSEIDSIPLFKDDESASEISPVGLCRNGDYGLEYSVIIENDYGNSRENIFGEGGICAECVGGVVRVDLIPDINGEYECRKVWENNEEISGSGMPKLSLATGLFYMYNYVSLPEEEEGYGWNFVALDFETGETVFRIPIGKGWKTANFGPPIILGPENGIAYSGVMAGIVTIQDG